MYVMHAVVRRIVLLALAATILGCASSARRSAPTALCYPQQCDLDVQNDQGLLIVVRYYDSTGVGDILGSVAPEAVRRFVLSRRTSRSITVEVSLDRGVYRATATLSLPPRENVVHFPTDFETISR